MLKELQTNFLFVAIATAFGPNLNKASKSLYKTVESKKALVTFIWGGGEHAVLQQHVFVGVDQQGPHGGLRRQLPLLVHQYEAQHGRDRLVHNRLLQNKHYDKG